MSKIIKLAAPALILPDGIHQAMMEQPCQQQQGHFVMGFMGGGDSFNIADYFNTTVFTNTGATLSATTGVDLSSNPGMIMFGENGSLSPMLFDTVRGATKYLQASAVGAETTNAGSLTGFNTNGFTVGGGRPNNGTTTAASSIRKHAKLFNVIAYAGNGVVRSIPHGVTGLPGLVIIKALNSGVTALVWHKGMAGQTNGTWGATAAVGGNPNLFGDGSVAKDPDATNVYLGSDPFDGTVNGSGVNYVMYVYADDPSGYTQSGAYVGNGSTTGPIITLGWEPQWLLIKHRDATWPWQVIDNVRGFGSNAKQWAATAYDATIPFTALSTGFQPINSNVKSNASGATYLYTA